MKPFVPAVLLLMGIVSTGCTPRTSAKYSSDVLASLLIQRAPLTKGGIDSKVRLLLKDGRQTAELDASSLCTDGQSVYFCGEEERIRAFAAGEYDGGEPPMRVFLKDLLRADARYWDPFERERDHSRTLAALEVVGAAIEVAGKVAEVVAKTGGKPGGTTQCETNCECGD